MHLCFIFRFLPHQHFEGTSTSKMALSFVYTSGIIEYPTVSQDHSKSHGSSFIIFPMKVPFPSKISSESKVAPCQHPKYNGGKLWKKKGEHATFPACRYDSTTVSTGWSKPDYDHAHTHTYIYIIYICITTINFPLYSHVIPFPFLDLLKDIKQLVNDSILWGMALRHINGTVYHIIYIKMPNLFMGIFHILC